MGKYTIDYIAGCPNCQMAKHPTDKPYGDLQPIDTPVIPLSVLCMDFLVGLPDSTNGNNAILIIACKTSKFIKIISGKDTFTAADWAVRYIQHVYADWGLPDAFIFDVDSKFLSDIWTGLCAAAGIDMKVTASHHQSANGQVERTIQVFQTAMVSLLGADMICLGLVEQE